MIVGTVSMESQESGVDMGFDVTQLIDIDENSSLEIGTIKSKPFVGT